MRCSSFFLLGLLLTGIMHLKAQTPSWKGTIGGLGNDEIQDVSIDLNGNYWVAGFMGQSMDADPGAGISNLTATAINTPILLKLSPSGSLLESFLFYSSLFAYGYSVENDADGNVYFQGYFWGDIDLDPSPNTSQTETSGGNGSSVFVVKLDNNGNFIWGKNIKTKGNTSGYKSQTMDVNEQGEVVLGGYFSDTLLISSISASDTELPQVGFNDGIVIRLDSDGDYLWSKQFAYPEQSVYTRTVAIDPNNFVSIGVEFIGGLQLYPEDIPLEETNTFNQDVYWARLMPDGTIIADWTLEGEGFDYINSMELLTNGDVLFAGTIQGNTDFDPTMTDVLLEPGNATDLGYVARYSSEGALIWAKGFNGDSKSYSHYALETSDGKIHVTGQHRQTTDFDPGAGIFNLSTQTPQQTDFDAFYCILNADGSFASAITFQGTNNSLGEALATNGNLVAMSGIFRGDLDLDPTVGNEIFNSQGEFDGFLAAFNPGTVGLNQSSLITNQDFIIFPNPTYAQSQIDLRSFQGELQIELVDASGRLVDLINVHGGNIFTLNSYPAGVYFVNVSVDNMTTKPILLVVKP